jgi:hypothetical protein
MSTVFQAFFVSYLVEPVYEKKIDTFEELLDSSTLYGVNDALEIGFVSTDYTDHMKIPESRRVSCGDLENCIRRLVTDDDDATVGVPIHVQYMASKFWKRET